MSKRTNELVKAISPKKKQVSKKEVIKAWLLREIWNGRPIHWTAVGLAYVAVAFASYELAKYYVAIPEFNGIIAFVSTFVIGSRAFKK